MRIEFIQAGSRYDAIKSCPWAEAILKVDGGYMCFEFYGDYIDWKSQK